MRISRSENLEKKKKWEKGQKGRARWVVKSLLKKIINADDCVECRDGGIARDRKTRSRAPLRSCGQDEELTSAVAAAAAAAAERRLHFVAFCSVARFFVVVVVVAVVFFYLF